MNTQARWLLLTLLAVVLTVVVLFQAVMNSRDAGRVAAGSGEVPELAETQGLSAAERLRELDSGELESARERGAALWARWSCAGCHQPGARSMRRQYPIEDLAARHDIDSLAAFLARPTAPMPAFPMSDSERRDLAIWLLAREL